MQQLTFKQTKQFLITPNAAISKFGTANSDLYFEIFDFFDPPENDDYVCSSIKLVDCSFPNAFDNITKASNIFSFVDVHDNQTKNINVPEGNYDIFEIIQILDSVSGEYDFTFDDVSNRVSIRSNDGHRLTIIGNQMSNKLGFTSGQESPHSTNPVIIAAFPPDLRFGESIIISMNDVFNVNHNLITNTNYCARVPFDVPYGETQLYSQQEEVFFNDTSAISTLYIKISDIEGNVMDFKDKNWEFCISLTKYFNKPPFGSNSSDELAQILEALFKKLQPFPAT